MKKIKLLIVISLVFSSALLNLAQGGITHRYGFSDPNDSIGTADALVVNNTGDATFVDGQLVLGNTGGEFSDAGNGDYVDLPNNLISDNGNVATFEFWLTWNGPETSGWQEFCSFGISSGGEDSSAGGGEYLAGIPRAGASPYTFRVTTRNGTNGAESWFDDDATLPIGQQVHIVIRWDGDEEEFFDAYLDGGFVGENNTIIDLSKMNDLNNWLGRSQWNDPLFVGSFNEFRIYDSFLSEKAIMANLAAGPDAMPVSIVYPEDGDIGIPTSITLEWDQAPVVAGDVTGYMVYFGDDQQAVTDADTSDISGVYRGTFDASTTSYPVPETLDTDVTYFWRVDYTSFRDPNTFEIKGCVCEFDTVASTPIFVAPWITDAKVFPGQDAQFTVNITGGGVPVFEWFKVTPGADQEIIDDGVKYIITTDTSSCTLTITDCGTTDEGEYYCKLGMEGSTKTVSSDVAKLILKKLIAHWPFDENTLDIVGGYDAIIEGSPTIEIGDSNSILGGGAVELHGAPDQLHVPTPVFENGSWSMSVWEFCPSPDNIGYILASGDPDGYESFYTRRWNDGVGSYLTGGMNSNYYGLTISYDYTSTGQWHLMTLVYDDEAIVWQNYLDGRATGAVNGVPFAGFDDYIYLGGRKVHPDGDNSRYYIGRFDDMRFYNYAIDKWEVAELYVEGKPDDPVCVELPVFDITGDCKVGIDDFATMAAEWMVCNLHPDCI